MRKNIKKIYKFVLSLLLVIILLPVGASLLLLLPSIQTRIVQFVAQQMSDKYQTEISVSGVYVSPLGGVSVNDVLVKDQSGDSLLYVSRLKGSIAYISLRKHQLYFRSVRFDAPKIHIHKTGSIFNYSFLFAGSDTTEQVSPWDIRTSAVELINGTMAWKSDDSVNVFSRIDIRDIRVDKLNLMAREISLAPDSLTATLEHLSFVEKSGFGIKDGSFRAYKTDRSIGVSDFHLLTGQSEIVVDTAMVKFDSIPQLAHLDSNVKFKLLLEKGLVSPADWAYFAFWGDSIKAPLSLAGKFSGSLPNLKGDSVVFSFGRESSVETNFNLVGLPRVEETFLFLDITDLSTNASDLGLLLSGLPGSKIDALPVSFNRLGTIKYKGNFTGFINDLVAYGRFTTRLGNISTDIGVKVTDRVTFSGSFKTVGFDVGRMLNLREHVGRVTMNMEVNGSHQNNRSYFAYLKGKIDSVNVRNYKLQNVQLNGLFANQKFDGQVQVHDPIGHLDFTGNVDLSGTLPNFNFFAKVDNLNLGKLNLLPSLNDAFLSFDMVSNFDGASLDDLAGFFRVDDALLASPGRDIHVDSLVVSAERFEDKKRLLVRSDLLTVEIDGHYNLTRIGNDLSQLVASYIPSIQKGKSKYVASGLNDFSFHVYTNKLGQLLNFIDPEIELSQGVVFEGRFTNDRNQLLIDGEVPFAKYGMVKTENLVVNAFSNENLALSFHVDNMTLWNKLDLRNFTIQQLASNNKLSTNVFWNNWDARSNSGAILTNTQFSRSDSALTAAIDLATSQIVVNDTVWNINPAKLIVTDQDFSIDNFRMWHNNQQIVVNGKVSKQGNDGINGYIRNINLGNILSNVKLGSISIGGMLNAEFQAQNFYYTPTVVGEISIDEFEFNKQRLGRFVASSDWMMSQNALELDMLLAEGGKEKIKGGCKYYIDTREVDLKANVNECEIGFLELWLSSIAKNIKGTTSGTISLEGKIDNPVLTGRLKVNDGRLDIGLLKTTYSLTDSVILEPNRIVFQNMTIRDRYNHRGTFKGYIAHTSFSGMTYHMTVDVNNMLVMDTKLKDNPIYYGTVFGTGTMKVTGVASLVNIDIAGKSMPNTQFYIPVQSDSEVGNNEFIRFASSKADTETNKAPAPDYKIDLAGVEMNMDIEITPDAKVQVIFDQRVGDILKGSGTGDIQIKMDKYSNISMFGNILIEEGDYLFSFQNVVNKKFVINRGGTIRWDGDPFNALININAIYKLRASLSDLVGSAASDNSSLADLKKRIPVDCSLYLTDRLMRPSIRFGIETPTLEQSYSSLLKEYIHTDEELNRQVLSLLVLNRFYSPEMQKGTEQSSDRGSTNAALVTTTEMLSNQFSNWLSQINNDIDVDVNYRPGDDISKREIEVALSTQLFNDRVSINTNVGYEEYQSTAKASSFIGDFEMNVKLNSTGTVRAHAYTRTNNDIIYTSTSPTKQGVGVSFREEFNTWDELWAKYWAIIRGDGKKKKKTKEEGASQNGE
ncbi:MAG: translocation/assembly module TamB domain-containing protein [Breznakibacter sp.]